MYLKEGLGAIKFSKTCSIHFFEKQFFLGKKNDISKMRIFGYTWKLSKVGKMLQNNKNNVFFVFSVYELTI